MVKARLSPGDALDGFLIGKVVHAGGMAHLYEVRHLKHDLPMLMKVPILAEGEDPAAIVGFEMEQMIMPRISGPHVPRFIALGDFSHQPYIVFERIAGETLFKQLEKLPHAPAEVAAIGAKVATALHDLHGQHVIHLDVKPSNVIMREASDEAVLIDFGLSHHEHLPDLMAEEFRVPYGSAPYMAPEQVFGIRTDLRSDIFALGVLMYFFATGTRPFGEPQSLKGLKRRLWQDPLPPRALVPAMPPWLQEIILKCLAPDPAARYATAAQLAFDLGHPGEVALTTRAAKLARDPWSARIKRRYHPDSYRPEPGRSHSELTARLGAAPIVAAAIDLSESHKHLAEAIRTAVTRILATLPEARLACLNVQKTNLIAVDQTMDSDGKNIHVRRLVQLKDWARGTGLPDERISCHVLEAVDPAAAILGYVEANNVEHVVLGASTGTLRNLLGSVASEIAQKAPCSVTVVRPRRQAEVGR